MLQGTVFGKKGEQFYKICDSKAVLVTIFVGLFHISVSAFHELREKGTSYLSL